MNKKNVVLGGILAIFVIALSACQEELPETAQPHPTTLATKTPAVPTVTETQPIATVLPSPSPSPEKEVSVPFIDALPDSDMPPFTPYVQGEANYRAGIVIGSDNADQVGELAGWGRGTIYEVELSPDGSRVAVRTALGVGLYETKSMEEIQFLELDEDYTNLRMSIVGIYNLVEFSPSSEALAVIVENQVQVLDASDGSSLITLEGEGENYQLMSIAYSPDGELLAGSEGWSADVNIWRLKDGTLLQTWKETPANSLVFSPDGQLLVSSNGEMHRISDGSLLYNLGDPDYGINQMMFSTDGAHLLAYEGMEGRLGIWKTEDGQLLRFFEGYASAILTADQEDFTLVSTTGEVQRISFDDGRLISSTQLDHPDFSSERVLDYDVDGSRLVTTTSTGLVSMWDLSSGMRAYELKAHYRFVNQVESSTDGQIMVTADDDWVRTWRSIDGTPLESLRLGYSTPAVSPDTGTLVTDPHVYLSGMRVWNGSDGTLRFVLEEALWPLAFSADSQMLAVATRSVNDTGWIRNTISVHNLSDGSLLLELDDGDTEFDDPVFDLSFSPDGSLLAAIRNYNDLAVWSMPDGRLLYELIGADYIPFVNMAFSPNGQYLVTGSDYHKVLVLSAIDGKMLQELPMDATEVMGESGQVSKLAFSPDGELLAATDEGGFYQLWRVEDWSTLQHNSDFINQLYSPSVAMSFSPDGSILAIGGSGNVISLWSVADGTLLTTLAGHIDGIVRVGFSPDGSWIYSTSLDGTVRFWGVAP